MEFADLASPASVVVFFQEEEFRTTEDPRPVRTPEGLFYKALALDKRNHDVIVKWRMTKAYDLQQGFTDHCDSSKPTDVIYL